MAALTRLTSTPGMPPTSVGSWRGFWSTQAWSARRCVAHRPGRRQAENAVAGYASGRRSRASTSQNADDCRAMSSSSTRASTARPSSPSGPPVARVSGARPDPSEPSSKRGARLTSQREDSAQAGEPPGGRAGRWRGSGGFGRAAGARPPAGAHLSCMPGQPACVGQCPAQQELDLGVGAAQFITGPSGQGVVHGGIQPQQYALALAHRVPPVPVVTVI